MDKWKILLWGLGGLAMGGLLYGTWMYTRGDIYLTASSSIGNLWCTILISKGIWRVGEKGYYIFKKTKYAILNKLGGKF